MTKHLLETILKLFAISAYTGMIKDYSDNLSEFIVSNVANKYREFFKNRFNEILEKHQSGESKKRLSVNSVKLIKYCSQLTEDTNIEQRILILISLFNFLKISKSFNNTQKEFLNLIADIFGIDKVDYENFLDLVGGNFDNINAGDLSYYYDKDECVSVAFLKTTGRQIIFSALKHGIYFNSIECKVGKLYVADYHSNISINNLHQLVYRDLKSMFSKKNNKESFELLVRDISVKIDDKLLLKKTCFSACSGELVGVIGKSGAGKTTLLKTLAGIHKCYTGEILQHKQNVYYGSFEKSYVSQENCFVPEFSIVEHLEDRLKHLQVLESQHKQRIDRVLSDVELELHKHKIAKSESKRGSQLSGGQQKRLNIALSLMHDPDVIIMDEPASGLSSPEALKIFGMLKSIALQNKIVICSVHQPDMKIFSMFDKLLFIDVGGYPVFYGKPAEAAEYFANYAERVDNQSVYNENYNPGIILDILDKKSPREKKVKPDPEIRHEIFLNATEKEYCKTRINKDTDFKKQSKTKHNSSVSVINFLKREFKILLKTPRTTALFLIIPVVLGILLSFISRQSHTEVYMYHYNPNIPAWILMLLLSAIFTGIISTGHEFINLRDFRKKEKLVIGKTKQYKLSKLLKTLLITFLQAFLLTFFSVIIVGVEFNFLKIFFVVWLLCFWGACCGLVLSLLFNSVSSVYLLVPAIIIPQILFSGALIDFKNFNDILRNDKKVPLLAEFVPLRWAGEAIMVDLYKNNKYEKPLFRTKLNLAESSYYYDLFIPEIISIYDLDSVRAKNILQNEILKNPRLPEPGKSFADNVNTIRSQYLILRENSYETMDSLLKELAFSGLSKQKYTNRSLADLMLNRHDMKNYFVYEDEIVRNFMPVYKLPDKNHIIGAHFLSPYKNFLFTYYIETYIYNLFVMILFVFFMILAIFAFCEKKVA